MLNWKNRKKKLRHVQASLHGQRVDVPAEADGAKLRRALAIPKSRMLIVRPGTGDMPRIIPAQGVIQLNDGDEFDDLPVGRWGSPACMKNVS